MQAKTTGVRAADSIEYTMIERLIRDRVRLNTHQLFQTDAEGLYDLYLENLPVDDRQHYNCRACRKFFDDYGGLVTITPVGTRQSLLFETTNVPEYFYSAFEELRAKVAKAKIVCPFVNYTKVWGKPVTGEWTHLSCSDAPIDKRKVGKEAHEVMAEFKEDWGMLQRAFGNYKLDIAQKALAFLESDTLYRNEKAIGIAKWFVQAHMNRKKTNFLWYMVATAPQGYCHINTTMISTLMDDLVAELPTDQIAKRWAEKMHPLQYQRPTKEVSNQAIQQAEKVVAEMGVARSLERRFADFSDVRNFIWVPMPDNKPQSAGSVFGHLKPQVQSNLMELPAQTMTWVKFKDTLLPTAVSLTYVPSMYQRQSYYGLVAPVHADAPPIIKWDNQVTWYVYNGGSMPTKFHVVGPTKITGIFQNPAHWSNPDAFKEEERKVFFALEGAYDMDYENGALFFPELLRGEFHGVRAVMEKYARTGKILGRGNVNGIMKTRGNNNQWGLTLVVETTVAKTSVTIDRFD